MQTLLGRKIGITKVRGQVFQLENFILFPLLHPAAALHQGNLMASLREDFQKLKQILDGISRRSEQNAPTKPVQMDLF